MYVENRKLVWLCRHLHLKLCHWTALRSSVSRTWRRGMSSWHSFLISSIRRDMKIADIIRSRIQRPAWATTKTALKAQHGNERVVRQTKLFASLNVLLTHAIEPMEARVRRPEYLFVDAAFWRVFCWFVFFSYSCLEITYAEEARYVSLNPQGSNIDGRSSFNPNSDCTPHRTNTSLRSHFPSDELCIYLQAAAVGLLPDGITDPLNASVRIERCSIFIVLVHFWMNQLFIIQFLNSPSRYCALRLSAALSSLENLKIWRLALLEWAFLMIYHHQSYLAALLWRPWSPKRISLRRYRQKFRRIKRGVPQRCFILELPFLRWGSIFPIYHHEGSEDSKKGNVVRLRQTQLSTHSPLHAIQDWQGITRMKRRSLEAYLWFQSLLASEGSFPNWARNFCVCLLPWGPLASTEFLRFCRVFSKQFRCDWCIQLKEVVRRPAHSFFPVLAFSHGHSRFLLAPRWWKMSWIFL